MQPTMRSEALSPRGSALATLAFPALFPGGQMLCVTQEELRGLGTAVERTPGKAAMVFGLGFLLSDPLWAPVGALVLDTFTPKTFLGITPGERLRRGHPPHQQTEPEDGTPAGLSLLNFRPFSRRM